MEQAVIRGIAHNNDVAKVSIIGVPDRPGIAGTLFDSIGEVGINILLIVQAQSHKGTNDITFVIGDDQVSLLKTKIDALVEEVDGNEAFINENAATVSVIGEGIAREDPSAGGRTGR